jgi:hypothetical protein
LFPHRADIPIAVFQKELVNSLTETMPQNSAANDGLKSSILFDVSHITAVLTGGGSGLGLMITQVWLVALLAVS